MRLFGFIWDYTYTIGRYVAQPCDSFGELLFRGRQINFRSSTRNFACSFFDCFLSLLWPLAEKHEALSFFMKRNYCKASTSSLENDE